MLLQDDEDEEDAARDDFMRSMRAGEVVVHAVSVALFQTMRVFKADPGNSTDNSEDPADHAAAKRRSSEDTMTRVRAVLTELESQLLQACWARFHQSQQDLLHAQRTIRELNEKIEAQRVNYMKEVTSLRGRQRTLDDDVVQALGGGDEEKIISEAEDDDGTMFFDLTGGMAERDKETIRMVVRDRVEHILSKLPRRKEDQKRIASLEADITAARREATDARTALEEAQAELEQARARAREKGDRVHSAACQTCMSGSHMMLLRGETEAGCTRTGCATAGSEPDEVETLRQRVAELEDALGGRGLGAAMGVVKRGERCGQLGRRESTLMEQSGDPRSARRRRLKHSSAEVSCPAREGCPVTRAVFRRLYRDAFERVERLEDLKLDIDHVIGEEAMEVLRQQRLVYRGTPAEIARIIEGRRGVQPVSEVNTVLGATDHGNYSWPPRELKSVAKGQKNADGWQPCDDGLMFKRFVEGQRLLRQIAHRQEVLTYSAAVFETPAEALAPNEDPRLKHLRGSLDFQLRQLGDSAFGGFAEGGGRRKRTKKDVEKSLELTSLEKQHKHKRSRERARRGRQVLEAALGLSGYYDDDSAQEDNIGVGAEWGTTSLPLLNAGHKKPPMAARRRPRVLL
ncbi:hypothetical protein FOL46_005657 [Perkinsus olseni]|uniref:Uncharacterized protein n=1 Tax=Perkinsus olseni TaxID=32597 RepID=A0A7J6LQR6_PEROL|nr:hypothetical protein FOL46_005657 [Perkinsus olseni]